MSPGLNLWFGLHIPVLALSFSVPLLAVVLIPLFFMGNVFVLLNALLKPA